MIFGYPRLLSWLNEDRRLYLSCTSSKAPRRPYPTCLEDAAHISSVVGKRRKERNMR